MKKIFILLFINFFPFACWAQSGDIKPEEVVTLIVSSNVFGEYEPCG